MAEKKFRQRPPEFRSLVPGLGGCLASDAVSVDGLDVGFMYRTPPVDKLDTGWSFLSGTESSEYLRNRDHFEVFDVNTVANWDPAIIPLLHHPAGAAFKRLPDGAFVAVEGPPIAEEDRRPPGHPFVFGEYRVTEYWTIDLTLPFRRRLENERLALWRPGITLWTSAYGNQSETTEERVAWLKSNASVGAFDWKEESTGRVRRLSYRLREPAQDGRCPAMYSFVVTDAGHLSLSIYFDLESDAEFAYALWRSVRPHADIEVPDEPG